MSQYLTLDHTTVSSPSMQSFREESWMNVNGEKMQQQSTTLRNHNAISTLLARHFKIAKEIKLSDIFSGHWSCWRQSHIVKSRDDSTLEDATQLHQPMGYL